MSSLSGKPSVLISDLGNVLAFFDHRTIAENLAAQLELHAEEIYDRFVTANIHSEYVLGKIDDQAFYEQARILFDQPGFPSFQQFAECWSDIFTTNWPMVDTLRELSSRMTLVMLSNTNNLHFRWIEEHHPEILDLFGGKLVLSHQVGAAKPDTRIFKEALRISGNNIQASDCLYIDDLAEYVAVAESLGMQAHQYESHAKFKQWIETVYN